MRKVYIFMMMGLMTFGTLSCGSDKKGSGSGSKSTSTGNQAGLLKVKRGPGKMVKSMVKGANKTIVKIKPKSFKKGDIVTIQSVLIHPQHTGLSKHKKGPKKGQIIPAHYINSINVYYNDKVVNSLKLYPSVSQDPYFSFKMKVKEAGKLKIVWKDNKGGSFEDSLLISE